MQRSGSRTWFVGRICSTTRRGSCCSFGSSVRRAPRYAHVPVLSDRSGQKLSKQTRATAVDAASPSENLWLILALLGHEPPKDLRGANPTELLTWAAAQWDIARIPRRATHSEFVCI